MKNFSTVGARFAAAALLAGMAAAPAQAANCAFQKDAPDQHQVVHGDTLWAISAKFLATPWCWPQVWDMNREEIANPHLIYPGQIIYFDRANARLSMKKPGAGDGAHGAASGGAAGDPTALRMRPQLRTEGLGKDAVQSIPAGAIEPFLTQPLIVEADELKGAPRIVTTREGHVFLGKDDVAYVRGDIKGGSSFQVYRPGNPLKDPESGKLLAYEAFYLGTVKLQAEGGKSSELHTFTVSSAKQEMGPGDLLMPAPPTPMRNYVPHQPERLVNARIIGNYGAGATAGQNQVVSINRGSLDGLDIGSVLQLYHFGKTVVDTSADKGWHNLKTPTVKLPDEQYGTVFIFRVFKQVAYGLIMQVTEPVQVGDVARSPE